MNYLDKFNRNTLIALKAIITSCSDNQLKSDELTKILKPQGFKPEGLGTNIMVYTHKDDKKKSVVYKIALDEYGIQNNFDDIQLSQDIPEFVQVHEVETQGLVSVQEYARACRSLEEIQIYYKKIFKILARLSKDYLIVDLSPDNIKNYGITKKGELKIIDGSDLVPLDNTIPIACQGIVFDKKGKRARCEHKLTYDDEYKKLVCPKCGKTHNPLEFKKKLKEVNIMKSKFFNDGLNDRERIELDQYVEKLRNNKSKANDMETPTLENSNIADDFNGDTFSVEEIEPTKHDIFESLKDLDLSENYKEFNESENDPRYHDPNEDQEYVEDNKSFNEFSIQLKDTDEPCYVTNNEDEIDEESDEHEGTDLSLERELLKAKLISRSNVEIIKKCKLSSVYGEFKEDSTDDEFEEESDNDDDEELDYDSEKIYEEFSSNREKKRNGQGKMKFPKE